MTYEFQTSLLKKSFETAVTAPTLPCDLSLVSLEVSQTTSRLCGGAVLAYIVPAGPAYMNVSVRLWAVH